MAELRRASRAKARPAASLDALPYALHDIETQLAENEMENASRIAHLADTATSIFELVRDLEDLPAQKHLGTAITLHETLHNHVHDVMHAQHVLAQHLATALPMVAKLQTAIERMQEEQPPPPLAPRVSAHARETQKVFYEMSRSESASPRRTTPKASPQRLAFKRTGVSSHPSMQMSPKRAAARLHTLQRQLVRGTAQNVARVRDEIAALEGLQRNRQRDARRRRQS